MEQGNTLYNNDYRSDDQKPLDEKSNLLRIAAIALVLVLLMGLFLKILFI